MSDPRNPGFANDVRPLFRERDREAMLSHFDLWSYDDVKANAVPIYERVDDGVMPCDGAWPREQVDLLRAWIDAGSPP
jgi:hypothetical protein